MQKLWEDRIDIKASTIGERFGISRNAVIGLARRRGWKARGTPHQKMLARPVANVDHAALSREHMARFPKIRTRLAEFSDEITPAMMNAGKDALFSVSGIVEGVGFFDADELVEKVYRAMAREGAA